MTLPSSARLGPYQITVQIGTGGHPNIAAIHGLQDSNGTRALVMELVEAAVVADV